jgi:hypothetical protein
VPADKRSPASACSRSRDGHQKIGHQKVGRFLVSGLYEGRTAVAAETALSTARVVDAPFAFTPPEFALAAAVHSFRSRAFVSTTIHQSQRQRVVTEESSCGPSVTPLVAACRLFGRQERICHVLQACRVRGLPRTYTSRRHFQLFRIAHVTHDSRSNGSSSQTQSSQSYQIDTLYVVDPSTVLRVAELRDAVFRDAVIRDAVIWC